MNGKIILAKAIPLTNGGEALVSCEDYHWLNQRKWYQGAAGYAICDLWGRRGGMRVLMHRLILLAPDTSTVDHANGNRLDNRRENLRLATQSQQNANRPKITGKSQFKGVYRRSDKHKWCAQIKPGNGKLIYLGSFNTEIDAARAYNAAASEHFKEFALLNVIEEGR